MKLGDENSSFSTVLKGMPEGIELAQRLIKIYNKFAVWLKLPEVRDTWLLK